MSPLMMRTVAWAQGVYFVPTGVWPLVHIGSFMAVTGPKTDLWLVRTVGVLILAIGLCITAAAWTGRIGRQTVLLAILTALGLTAIDVVYVAAGVISKIYLLDAIAEVVLVAVWAVSSRGAGRDSATSTASRGALHSE